MKISLEISCPRCVKMGSDSAQMKGNWFCFLRLPTENKDPLRADSQSQFLSSLTKLQVESNTIGMSEMRSYNSAEDIETLEFMNFFLMYFRWNAIWSIPTEE